MKRHLILTTAAFALVACSEPQEPREVATQTVQESVQENIQEATPPAAETAVAEPVQVEIAAPAGLYRLDPNHASLHFSVKHLGVSNYVVRFTSFDVTLDLNPDDLSASSVSATIDPASVRTDFSGDYQGTHPDSGFSSWDEDLAKSGNFLNAGEYPSITFKSTRVEQAPDGTLQVTGDLELLGQTRPITLEVEVVGSEQAHPFSGVGLIGFSARGTFNRSDFGMTHLLTPPLVGDTVTLQFEGEFLQEQDDDES